MKTLAFKSLTEKLFTMVLISFLICIFTFSKIYSAGFRQNVSDIKALRVTSQMVIDGVLDEEVWQSSPSVDDVFITYSPNDGDLFPKKTRVWVAYDNANIYFAFHCYDNEPMKIKTSITKRDDIFSEDWIGLALDTMGNRQSLYELYVNPSGVQGDIYNTSSYGENRSPDWVWYSGGRIVNDGYTVEIKLPLNSIRYRSGKNVIVNVAFYRRCSRLSVKGAWPAVDPGKGVFNSLGKIMFENLEKQRKLEFIPSLSYGSLWDRETPDSWSEADGKAEFGISAKIGLSSTTTLDFTINPDFSQVESDTFQITHNLRYPIFYNEKRPFFMGAGDMFSLSGSGNNMWPAVHTRKIVAPEWGVRITGGSGGKLSYSGLVASDVWPGRAFKGEENYYLGKRSLFTIGRLKYGIGGDNYIGVLYSGKELGDYHNRTFAVDSILRLGKSHSLKSNFISTATSDPENNENFSGNAFTAEYLHTTAKFYGRVNFDWFEKDFKMDTAFYQRTGITLSQVVLIPSFGIKSEKFRWIKSVKPVFVSNYLHDHITGLNNQYLNIGVMISFIKQGYLTLAWDVIDNEEWTGKLFKQKAKWGSGGVQILKWLNLNTSFSSGTSIYYDEEDPFLGKKLRIRSGLKVQLDSTISLYFSHEYTNFDRKNNGENVYDYHILYNKTSFQPTKHLGFRTLIQYDSYLDVIMSDILASYEFIPGTVFHIGYGSLNEKLKWDPRERQWLSDVDQRKYYQTTRSFFIKCSYRIQL